MTEHNLSHEVMAEVGPYGMLARVENRCDKGTPDISYLLRRYPKVDPVSGWLETKWEPRWSSPVKIRSLTKDQVLWQEAWAGSGGRVFTLIRFGRDRASDHLLIRPDLLRRIYEGTIDSPTLVSLAEVHWPGPFTVAGLIRCLTE